MKTKEAVRIMGKNFFSVEHALEHFKVIPLKEHFSVLSEVPFSKETLVKCRDTHILSAVFPISILEMEKMAEYGVFHKNFWDYSNEKFAKEKGKTSWHLISKNPIEKSVKRNWKEQQELLPRFEKVPAARVIVYSAIAHYLVTGEKLFEEVFIRTDSVASEGRVCVGNFNGDGFKITHDWGTGPVHFVGIVSDRNCIMSPEIS